MKNDLTKIVDVAKEATSVVDGSGFNPNIVKICELIDEHLKESFDFINEHPNFTDGGKIHDDHYNFLINKIIPIVAYTIDCGGIDKEMIDWIADNPDEYYAKIDGNGTANFLSDLFSDSITDGLFSSPASAKYHGNFLGGLFLHSLIVYKTTLISAPLYKIAPSDVSFIACMLHDLCKVDKYKWHTDENGILVISYDKESKSYYNSIQHGPESVRRILNLWYLTCASSAKYNSDKCTRFQKLNNPVEIFEESDMREDFYSEEWEQAVTYHMGIFDAGESEVKQFSAISEYNPYVLLLHHADMIASKVYGL